MFRKSDWKPGKIVQQKKFDLNLLSLYVPSYQISQLKTPGAFILNGKQLVFRKLPKNRDYFFDPDFGLFEIKPKDAYFFGNVPIYFYDVRNQNPIEPEIFAELFQWATSQGLYKIRRIDVEHAKRLRHVDQANLIEETKRAKLETRAFTSKVIEKVDEHNKSVEDRQGKEQGDPGSSEYKKYNDADTQFIIVDNLFKKGYIDPFQASILNHKLTTRKINSVDDLLHEIDTFTDVYVSKPISMEFERILDDYHTYQPSSIIQIIQQVTKITKGLKNLRTKPIVNWFPATYLLFGCLGVGIVIMLYMTYGQQTAPLPQIP